MKVKLFISLMFCALIIPNLAKAEVKREWLTGRKEFAANDGIQCICDKGTAIGYKINEERNRVIIRTGAEGNNAFELGYDKEKGWYVDINVRENAVIPPYEEGESTYEIVIPQEIKEKLQINGLVKGRNYKQIEIPDYENMEPEGTIKEYEVKIPQKEGEKLKITRTR